jgi:hypothetical protein
MPPWGEFTKLTLLPNNAGLEVTGPYNPGILGEQKVIGDVFIGFLIIQQDAQKDPTVIIDDVAKWTFAPPNANGEYANWSTIVPGAKIQAAGGGAGLKLGNVRAIGTAVQVTDYKPEDPHVPPGVTTFTWCVDKDVVAP